MSSLRCSHCSAHVPAGAQWCTLCYADLRPREEAAPTQPEAAKGSPSTGSGRHARPENREIDDAELARMAEQMLAELAVSESGARVGGWSRLVDTTGKKAVVMLGGALLASIVLVGLLALVGALL